MNLENLKILFPISLFLVGVIHLIPSRILLQSDFIETLYGIQTTDQSIKLIVLHRAVFFLFVGVFSILSSFLPKFYDVAFYISIVSMSSFIILHFLIPHENPKFNPIFKIDLFLVIILTLSYTINKYLEG
jgi:hypothetical protein